MPEKTNPTNNTNTIIEVKGLMKNFGGMYALRNINMNFRKGEIHALVGENGAGKSTLCKILSGAIAPTLGTVNLFGTEYEKLTPHMSKENGISMIYQEFNLVQDMTIYDNIFLGKEIRRGLSTNDAEMIRQTRMLFDTMGIKINPSSTISDISVAYCQLVEIAKVLKEDAKVIIMDEPTAPLTNQEVEVLFQIIKKLKANGITIIYISHRMDEIMTLSDRTTVMRDGEVIKTMDTKESTTGEIISLMVGRKLGMYFPPKGGYEGFKETRLMIRNLCNKKLKKISFKLHKGEILGLAGLVGSGRTEVVRAIFGVDKINDGEIFLNDKSVRIRSPDQAIRMGIGLIPEDRKRQGIHLDLSVRFNMSLIQLRSLSRYFTVQTKQENKLINDYINLLSIKMRSSEDNASNLSGGNQQKIVLTKWLATQADILFFDEPTRGIDISSKVEIYELLANLRRQGKAIVMISSEMPEIVGMCDRILVLHEGELMGELGKDANQGQIMELASGVKTGGVNYEKS
jgi:ribose transport system ATP-binding protein